MTWDAIFPNGKAAILRLHLACHPEADQPHVGATVQENPQQDSAGLHQKLVDAYLREAGVTEPVALPDDGYILQAIGHHLSFAGRLQQLKALLMSPDWLEQKLHAYGRVAVVADFRR